MLIRFEYTSDIKPAALGELKHIFHKMWVILYPLLKVCVIKVSYLEASPEFVIRDLIFVF